MVLLHLPFLFCVFILCICFAYTCLCIPHVPGVCEGQKREGVGSPGTGDTMAIKRELCVLGTGSSARAISTLNHRVAPSLKFFFFFLGDRVFQCSPGCPGT